MSTKLRYMPGLETPTFSDLYTSQEAFVATFRQSPYNDTIGASWTDSELYRVYWWLIPHYHGSRLVREERDICNVLVMHKVRNHYPICKARLGLADDINALTGDDLMAAGQNVSTNANRPDNKSVTGDGTDMPYVGFKELRTAKKDNLSSLTDKFLNLPDWASIVEAFTDEFKPLFRTIILAPVLPFFVNYGASEGVTDDIEEEDE